MGSHVFGFFGVRQFFITLRSRKIEGDSARRVVFHMYG